MNALITAGVVVPIVLIVGLFAASFLPSDPVWVSDLESRGLLGPLLGVILLVGTVVLGVALTAGAYAHA